MKTFRALFNDDMARTGRDAFARLWSGGDELLRLPSLSAAQWDKLLSSEK